MTHSIGSTILQLVGGVNNVEAFTHCMARLRFTLHDADKADRDALTALDEVVIVLDRSGQLQIGLRRDLLDTYDAICDLLPSPT